MAGSREEALERAKQAQRQLLESRSPLPLVGAVANRAQNIFDSASKKVDDIFTNYLRNTTTDQEILDYYGEGSIIGRKGIPDNNRELLDQFTSFRSGKVSRRPSVKTETGTFGVMGEPITEKNISDISGAINPQSNRPWQMEFARMAFPPREGSPTMAAQRFFEDFRVPEGNTSDYGFRVSPNIEDVKDKRISELLSDPRNYENKRKAFLAEDENLPISEYGDLSKGGKNRLEDLKEIRFGGLTVTEKGGGAYGTPGDWKAQEGFEPPGNIRDSVLNKFKEEIMSAEKPFGSVSQLTPIRQHPSSLRPGGDPDWRANLYEKAGIAGPLSETSVRGDYGPMKADVQAFVRGNERLLPIQPYTEFFSGMMDASKASAVGGPPAPGFTRLQEAIGTRNYLIGRNILDGRGSLGAPVRAAKGVGAVGTGFRAAGNALSALPLMDPEFQEAFDKRQGKRAAALTARDAGIQAVGQYGTAAAAGALQRSAPAAASRVLPAVAAAGNVAGGLTWATLAPGSAPVNRVTDRQAAEAQKNRARAAQERGGRWRIGSLTIPDLGISESGGLFLGPGSRRRLGTRSTKGGKPVIWAGDNYEWQSPESALKLGVRPL